MSADHEVDAMHERTEWAANLRALRALWVLSREAMRKADESFERLKVLAAELAECDPPEAWSDPETVAGDRILETGIYYVRFEVHATKPNGDWHRSGAKRPPLPEGSHWTLSMGTAIAERDGQPKNEELGARCHVAWREHNTIGGAAHAARAAYETAVRAFLEAP